MFIINLLGILLYLCHYSLQISTPNNDSYIGAVMECNFNRLEKNVDKIWQLYSENIVEAAKQGADIFVSPTGPHLTMFRIAVPNNLLKECPVPANCPEKFNEALVLLSKAARDNKIYLVINLLEYLDCTTPREDETCPGNQEYRRNTNVVFDRNGAVIAKAAQYHTWYEPEVTPEMNSNVSSSFTTDFGVEFGSVIDFDVFFPTPTAVLVTQKNISNIVMPSKWYTELPFLTSIEVAKAFPTGYNINLLAAGNNNFKNGNGGSSIITGPITLVSLMQKISDCRLLVSKVPKAPGQVTTSYPGPTEINPAELDNLRTLTDPSLDKFITVPLKPGYQIITRVCRDITCQIIANVSLGSGKQFYRYRLGVFSGVRKLGLNNTVGARACAIMACTGDDIYSCGKRFPMYKKNSFAKFSQLTVIGTAPKRMLDPVERIYDSTFFRTFSTSSLSSLQPESVDYKEKTIGIRTTYTLSLKKFDAELYTFGFWGRKFADDGKMESEPRIENNINSTLVSPSDNSTPTSETSQGNGLFSTLLEVLAAIYRLKKLVPRILRTLIIED